MGDFDVVGAVSWIIPVILAITLHEAAHAWTAWKLGDDTALRLGRVTFNPIRHIDPFGTILLPGILLLTGASFLFGWAKPVPVAFHRLRNPRRDMMLVALAGPGVNIALAIASAVLYRFSDSLPFPLGGPFLTDMLEKSIIMNVGLAVFNMLPIPPLDGSRVLAWLLPLTLARPYMRLEQYGMFIVIGLFMIVPLVTAQLGMRFSPVSYLVGPPFDWTLSGIVWLTGLGA